MKSDSRSPAKLAEATAPTGRLIWENSSKTMRVTVEEWWLKIKITDAAAVDKSLKEAIKMFRSLARLG